MSLKVRGSFLHTLFSFLKLYCYLLHLCTSRLPVKKKNLQKTFLFIRTYFPNIFLNLLKCRQMFIYIKHNHLSSQCSKKCKNIFVSENLLLHVMQKKIFQHFRCLFLFLQIYTNFSFLWLRVFLSKELNKIFPSE